MIAPPALAQTVPQQSVPGALPTREQLTPLPPEAPPAARVDVDSRGALERQNCPFEGSALRVDLSRVTFTRPDGSPLAPAIAATLAGVVAPGQDAPISAVCDIRDAANAALRRDGWIASVQVPPQEIDAGALRLDVITARIVETRVRGAPGAYEAALRTRIAELEALDPLNERDAERLLLLAGDLPGLDVQLSLRPAGTAPGEVIGDLAISYRPWAVLGNFQNYNSPLLGRETGYLRGEVYGLTGMGDTTYVGVSTTRDFEEQRIVQAGHIMTLDTAGTTFGLRATKAWSRPDIGALDLRSDTLVAGFDVRRPLVRSLMSNLALDAGFDYVNQDSRVTAGGNSAPLSRDRLRILYLGIDGEARATGRGGLTNWSARGALSIRKGLDLFGASEGGVIPIGGALPSRIDGNARAFVVRGDLDTVVRLTPILSFAARIQGQWTNDPLLNYEEYSIGNLTVGRGYDPGSNTGDRAIAFRSEVRADVWRRDDFDLQLFGFIDTVKLTNLDPNATETDRTLRSYGGGIRASLTNNALLEVTYAHPRDPALLIDQRPPPDRVLVSLTFQFRPRPR
ncbi:ShlB/FhaC/HecB family hemolysin secretion/activation protein [Sphingomonas sp.]|uniref:ShlB/FhaC/HecB family hemolysin secretion/activation protein n=1 Tax=Sphingomonas sp. TaxID=28214 RepID=UPI002DD64072|nr:ShlB/FhaC/HecB family hemolysin secretion/activation protein [Sphingomonas sp.]